MLFRVQPLPQLSSKTFEAFSPELVTLKNQVQFVPSVSLSYFLRAWGATSKILSHNGEDQIAKRGREWMDCVRGQAFFFVWPFGVHEPLQLRHLVQSPHAKQQPEADWWSGNRTVCLEQIWTGHLPLWWSLGRRYGCRGTHHDHHWNFPKTRKEIGRVS